MSSALYDLAAMRREIDSIDEKLHDLLMRRGEVVAEIGRRKAVAGEVTFRPAREAQLLRGLLARHRGALSEEAIVRIWREIVAASIQIQAKLTVGYCPIEEHGIALSLAKEHFGLDAAVVRFETASHVISAVNRGEASVGIVPLPQNSELAGWLDDIRGMSDLYVVARLPWFSPLADSADARVGALVVARSAPEESGDDHSLLMFSCFSSVGRERVSEVCAAEGLSPVSQAVANDPHQDDHLLHIVEVDGFVGAEDARTQTVALKLEASNTRFLGAFARPLVAGSKKGEK